MERLFCKEKTLLVFLVPLSNRRDGLIHQQATNWAVVFCRNGDAEYYLSFFDELYIEGDRDFVAD